MQLAFAEVEVKPQAIEWLFSVAAGIAFNFSADNLNEGGSVIGLQWRQFQSRVANMASSLSKTGLPRRADAFISRLAQFYGTGDRWRDEANYQLESWGEVQELHETLATRLTIS